MKQLSSESPRYRTLIQLLKTSEILWDVCREFLNPWKISPSQLNVLLQLHHNPAGRTQSDLSRALITHRSNITGLVDRLEKRQLLKRTEMPEDRRSWKVQLTAKGKALVNELLPQYYSLAEGVWGKTSPQQAQELTKEMEALAERALVMQREIKR